MVEHRLPSQSDGFLSLVAPDYGTDPLIACISHVRATEASSPVANEQLCIASTTSVAAHSIATISHKPQTLLCRYYSLSAKSQQNLYWIWFQGMRLFECDNDGAVNPSRCLLNFIVTLEK